MRDVHFDEAGVVVDVAPTWRKPRCSVCGRRCAGYDRDRGRRWRHLDLAGMLFHLRYDLRRVACPTCGVKIEQVPWAETGSWFTRPFEDHVGYLAQRCDKTTVSGMMRIAWDTVGALIQRVVARHGDSGRLNGLTRIGVDELSYRRHHEYITVVVDHDRGRVVWAHPGKNADTLKTFFDELGPERCAKLEAVTIDMSEAYIKAVTACSPQAQIVFDRFHVQRLAQDAVDEVRRDEVRAASSDEERKQVKRTRWALLKSFWNLSLFDSIRLSKLQRENKRLPGLPAQGSLGRRPGLSRRMARTAEARRVDPMGATLAARTLQAHCRHHPRPRGRDPRLRPLGALQWQDRGPQRQGAHPHASRVRPSQRPQSHRLTHAVLRRHSPPARSPLARIHPLNLVESPLTRRV
ncbi:MAG TPA: ISL3 family transposase [Kofleriaceae bacterium]|nr:ISL3 family transposase [Kofleriaceae bacterium]